MSFEELPPSLAHCYLVGVGALVCFINVCRVIGDVKIPIPKVGELQPPRTFTRQKLEATVTLVLLVIFVGSFLACIWEAAIRQPPALQGGQQDTPPLRDGRDSNERNEGTGPSLSVIDRDSATQEPIEAEIYLLHGSKPRVRLGITNGGDYRLADSLRCVEGMQLNVVPTDEEYSDAMIGCPIEENRRQIRVRRRQYIENLVYNAARLEEMCNYALAAFVYNELVGSEPAYSSILLKRIVRLVLRVEGNPLEFRGEPMNEDGLLTAPFRGAVSAYQRRQGITDTRGRLDRATLSALAGGASTSRYLYGRLPMITPFCE